MNQFKKHMRCLCLLIMLLRLCQSGNAQNIPINEPDNNLPAAFPTISDTIPVTIQKLEAVFNTTAGEEITLELSPGFILQGKIITKTFKYGGAIESFNFLSNQKNNMLVVGTKTKLPSGATSYSCHITGKEVIDALYLSVKNGHYFFLKKNIHTLRAE